MRRTKIVCTIGPKTCSYEKLEQLSQGGMNIARLNMSHGDHAWHRSVIKGIRTINEKGLASVSLMLDTKGPEIRSGDLKESVKLKKGDTFTFTTRHQAEYEPNTTEVSYDGFIDDVQVGDVILIDSGMLSLKVMGKTVTDIRCESLDEGTITSRRHVNIRGKSPNLPSITERDWEDINFGIEEGVDCIALSFVKSPEAIVELKKYLEEKEASIDVIAKIESMEALPKLKEILEVADGAMVARGDLGAELPVEDVPLVQEEMVRLCRRLGKPVIVATQMLESMIVHPTPTRAEVTDITHAVLQGTDCTMLSGETAAGKHPFKALEVMDTVIRRIEGRPRNGTPKEEVVPPSEDSKREIARSAAAMADHLKAKGLLVFTRRGLMATLLSQARPDAPIFAFTNMSAIRRRLNIFWGVTGFRIEFSQDPEKTIQRAITLLSERNFLQKNDRIIIVSDILAGESFVETIQVRTL